MSIIIEELFPEVCNLFGDMGYMRYLKLCLPDAEFIELVPHITDELRAMGKGSASAVGTGGMAAKIDAAIIATEAGADMIIANSKEVDIISSILNGDNIGTLFLANKADNFNLADYL